MLLERRTFRLSEAKAKGDEAGKFTGKASVYGVVDSYGDVVMPGAFTKTLAENGGRIKVLSQHNANDVIGLATLADSPDALLVTEGALELELQSARDAYVRLKGGLIDGISIGYVTRDAEWKGGNRLLTDIELWEVSLVTFPANPYALVSGVKGGVADAFAAIDRALLEIKRVAGLYAEIKAGRMLSSANEDKIRTAYDSLKSIVDALDADKNAELKARETESERLALVTVSETLGKLLKA
jgi:HK97 family phage prohead protease